ncbi:MAG: hypothetical protein ACKVJK_17880, partial [Methylophagaceae bacterium]
ANVNVTGVVGTTALGTVTVSADANVNVTGVEGVGQTSRPLVWSDIVPGQNARWADIDDSQTDVWADINTTQDPEWEDIAA